MKKICLIITILYLSLSSCKKENMCDCFKSTGKITSEYRIMDPFSSIYLGENVNLFLSCDSSFSVRVEAGKNLLPLIKTHVENGSLFINNNNKCNWVRSYKPQVNVYVSMPKLLFLEYSGCGDITMENTFAGDSMYFNSKNGSGNVRLNLNTNKLYLIINTGPLDVSVKGSANELQLYYIGTGMIHCEDFTTKYTYVVNKSTGNCYINVQDLLIYHLEWTGNIYYTGNPANVQGETTGTGKIIPL